jgi:hypothetical protein
MAENSGPRFADIAIVRQWVLEWWRSPDGLTQVVRFSPGNGAIYIVMIVNLGESAGTMIGPQCRGWVTWLNRDRGPRSVRVDHDLKPSEDFLSLMEGLGINDWADAEPLMAIIAAAVMEFTGTERLLTWGTGVADAS